MAFDQNGVPKDLRPLNIARSNLVSDDSCQNQMGRPDSTSPSPPIAVYYTDAFRLPGVGYMNLGGPLPAQVPVWTGRIPGPPNFGSSPSGNVNSSANVTVSGSASSVGTVATPSDRASEDGNGHGGGGAEDSVSGRKVKFLCSFGGKILPRPSDGTLRYVGGQTRIISVRRDVTFAELVQKMVDTYGQPVVIKYQLPYEDLDALVSVSCPDDLDNMMEEYAKLLESCPDGSVKLRVFLFSASEVDSTGLVHLGDFQDSGLKYVDAVNGVVDGSGGGGGITRKESIASVASTQNSDASATEVLDPAIGHEVSGPPANMFYQKSDSGVSNENNLRVETGASLFTVPGVVIPQSALQREVVIPQSALQREVELERTVPFQVHGQPYDLSHTTMNFPQPPPSPYLGNYVDHQDRFGRANYQQLPPQVAYSNAQGLGAPKPVIVQTQYPDSAPTVLSQYVTTVPITVGPASSHMSLNPNVVQPRRVVANPAEQNYTNANPAQMGGGYGGYGWHQITYQDQHHVALSEGWIPQQHGIIRSPDCYMCQKALPHAHSDNLVQNNRSTIDSIPIYQSLHLDDVSKIHGMVTQGPMMGYGGEVQTSPIANIGNTLVPRQENAGGEHVFVSSQPKQDVLVSKLVGSDSNIVSGTPCFGSDSSTTCQTVFGEEVVRQPVDLMMENMDKPIDVHEPSPSNKSPIDLKEDFIEQVHSHTVLHDIDQSKAPNMPHHVHPLDPFEALESNATMVDMISNNYLSDRGMVGSDNATDDVNPSVSPHNWAAMVNESPNSLFSNEDPWNMRPEAHFPPPKPTKITMKRESSFKELHGGEVDPNSDPHGSKPIFESSKGSSEDRIKQQLQSTAEGVAASVLHSSATSELSSLETNVSSPETGHGMEGKNSDAHIQSKMEAMNIKPEKANLGFPMSDGMGRLQIIKNSDLEELRELGSGTFGTVYHGKWRGTDVAIKRINDRCFAGKPSEQDRMRDDFWNEAIKLADLHHPNVVAFYGVVLDGPGGSVATVTEYMVNGSLRTALQKNERNLDKRKRLLIAMDVAFGMEYLHSKNIVHFDLKSDNLLVNLRDPHRPICKVGDLGLSKVKCQTLISGGVRGTLPWMAPELLNGSSSLVSEKVDVFSFGIVMWELLTGEEPYADLHYGAIIGGIVSNTLRPVVPETCDPDWRILMERCWSAEPTERPIFTEIANELRTMAAKVPPKVQTPATNAKPVV